MKARAGRAWSWRRKLAVTWAALLVLSHAIWWLRERQPDELDEEERATLVPEIDAEKATSEELRLVWREHPANRDGAPTLLLLHGSPGHKEHFDDVVARLAGRFRLVAVDLPGFGKSTRSLPDYSISAQAREVLAFCRELDLDGVHLLGFSLGGGVAVEMVNLEPERFRSIILLSSIGVQELELFGTYEMNHALHGLQLWLILFARWCVPHFGIDDGLASARSYARSFYDSVQRALRAMLVSLPVPMLFVHGEDDFLVSPAVAHEHHRVVPHSELAMLPGDHFLLWTKADLVADLVAGWVERVDSGAVPDRSRAAPERLRAAAEPFDPGSVPRYEGLALIVLLVMIAASTLVSEDLACIAAGLLIAQGRVSFLAGTLAAFSGIFFGDVLLYLAGRILGRPALARRPLCWFIKPEDVERAKVWFAHRGARVIFASRFVPGLRLPTYFVAGAVHASFLSFGIYFVLAGLLWTPIVVGLAAWIGAEAVRSVEMFERLALPALLVLAVLLLVVQRFVFPLFTWRGRRLLRGKLRRRLSFEFWPPWIFYAPVAAHIAQLALRHKSLTVVTAVNPGMPTGGFIGESKSRILAAIDDGSGDVASFVPIPAALSQPERLEATRSFLAERRLGFPVVLKPDVGQRGSGVSILGDERALEVALDTMRVDSLLQQYAPGQELGVFYVREPSEARGRIFSITEKRLPVVVGDGRRTLEELILADGRAVCMAPTYFRINAARLLTVPDAGARVNLVELGTHCRGAIFLNGSWANSPGLGQAIDRISARFDGFYFGRYDIRVRSPEELVNGRGFQVIELNGLTSEATHIYDPRTKLIEAWRVLFEQWRLAFSIGATNSAAGARVWTLRELWHEINAYKKLQAEHLPTGWQWGLETSETGDKAPRPVER